MQTLQPTNENATPDTVGRAIRRQKKKDNENMASSRSSTGQKAYELRILEGGKIDATCTGKNAWDEAVRSLVPRLLDLSVIEWEGQNPTAMKKLRDALDEEFEYVGFGMSRGCFKNAIKRFMRTERSRLKARYMAGESTCPVHVDPQQWKRLQAYWESEDQVEKADKMANARRNVRLTANVGRKGKYGKGSAGVSCNLALVCYKVSLHLYVYKMTSKFCKR
jgi:hypothetical protein